MMALDLLRVDFGFLIYWEIANLFSLDSGPIKIYTVQYSRDTELYEVKHVSFWPLKNASLSSIKNHEIGRLLLSILAYSENA